VFPRPAAGYAVPPNELCGLATAHDGDWPDRGKIAPHLGVGKGHRAIAKTAWPFEQHPLSSLQAPKSSAPGPEMPCSQAAQVARRALRADRGAIMARRWRRKVTLARATAMGMPTVDESGFPAGADWPALPAANRTMSSCIGGASRCGAWVITRMTGLSSPVIRSSSNVRGQ
jgi:hypothetical protein